jgi:hypothetical protein
VNVFFTEPFTSTVIRCSSHLMLGAAPWLRT